MSSLSRYAPRIAGFPGRYPPPIPHAEAIRAGEITEHNYCRDDLARTVGGLIEVRLPFGRADVVSETAVFEVEPITSWRAGVRQVIAYAAQVGLPPHLALFGEASRTQVTDLYVHLRNATPRIWLWWHDGWTWRHLSSRRSCAAMPGMDWRPPRQVIRDLSDLGLFDYGPFVSGEYGC